MMLLYLASVASFCVLLVSLWVVHRVDRDRLSALGEICDQLDATTTNKPQPTAPRERRPRDE